MQRMGIAIILIILGLIVLAFPILGVIPIALITGGLILLFSIGLLLGGIFAINENIPLGILLIILGLLSLIIGIEFIFNPDLFAFLAGLLIYIIGIFFIIIGIIGIITNSSWNGAFPIIMGLLYIILGSIITNPLHLGILIGLWLLIMGIIMLFAK